MHTSAPAPARSIDGAAPWDRSRVAARRDRTLLALVGMGAFAVYLAIERGRIDGWDGQVMASVGQNLLQHHSIKECCNAYGAFPLDPGPYSKFGIGYSLILAPLWHFQLARDPTGATWLGVANPLLLAATAVVLTKTGLLLGWRRSTAVLIALAFAFLTMSPLYSTTFFSEPGVTFATALAMLGVVVWDQRGPPGAPIVGLAIAIAIVFRADSIVLLGVIVPMLALFKSREALRTTWRSWTMPLAAPLVAAVAWTLWYDWLRYRNPLQVGYSGAYDSLGFSHPLVHGAALLLVSPGKSLFVYAPILIAAIPGLVFLARRRQPLTVVILVVFAARVLFYARWYTPEGGDSWGPRFLLPVCALLAIPLGETFERVLRLRRPARTRALGAIALAALASVVVQLASVLVSYRDVFVPRRPPFDAHAYHWTFGGQNHIVWNLQHIGSRQVSMPLYWFQHGATVFGVSMLVVGALMCAAATELAFVADRSARAGGERRERPPIRAVRGGAPGSPPTRTPRGGAAGSRPGGS